MFPQNLTLSLSVKESPAESRQLLSDLLRGNQSVSGTVVKSTPAQNPAGSFQVQVEINGRNVQLITQQQPENGSQIQLSRGQDGKLVAQVTVQPGTPLPLKPATTALPQPTLPAQIQLSQVSGSPLQLPAGTSISAVVIKNTPLQLLATPQPATNSAATYARPLSTGEATGTSPTLPSNRNSGPASTPTVQSTVHSAQGSQAPASRAPANTAQPAPGIPSTTAESAQQSNPRATGMQQPAPAAPPAATQSQSNTAAATQSSTVPASSQSSGQLPPGATASRAAQPVQTTSSTPPVASPAGQTAPPTAPITNSTGASAQPAAATTSPGPTSAPQQAQTTGSAASPVNTAQSPAGAAPQTTTTSASGQTGFNLQLLLSDGRSLTLRSESPLPPNTTIKLTQVSPQQFTAVPESSTANKTATANEQAIIQDALRNALPLQQPVGDALSQLQATTQQNASANLSSVVRSMLQLFGLRPGNAEAPRTVQSNVQLGGLQTESNIALSGKVEKRDMKAVLQQLQQHAAELPAEQRGRLEQLIQSIQSRITSNQLSSLQQWKEQPDGSFERVMQLDIPVMQRNNVDNIELRISQEASRNEEGTLTTQWRVRLHFELEEKGSVDAELKLNADDEVQIQFWCSHKRTHQQIQQKLEDFGGQLRQRGFNEAELSSYHGKAPHRQKESIDKRLVDIHT